MHSFWCMYIVPLSFSVAALPCVLCLTRVCLIFIYSSQVCLSTHLCADLHVHTKHVCTCLYSMCKYVSHFTVSLLVYSCSGTTLEADCVVYFISRLVNSASQALLMLHRNSENLFLLNLLLELEPRHLYTHGHLCVCVCLCLCTGGLEGALSFSSLRKP